MTINTICIFTQSPLCRAPRVVKEANVYARAGYKVTVFGLWSDPDLLKKDRRLLEATIQYKAGVDLLDVTSFKARKIRIVRRIGRELVKGLQIETMAALGYDFKGYLTRLKNEAADLYIGHEELSMALAEQLIKEGKNVAFDFEDWHSMDLLPKDRAYRPLRLIERLERFILTNATYTYTTSQAMALAMCDKYNTKPAKVIYNSFPASERNVITEGAHKDRMDLKLPSLYWFSQVISEGRGLELLFQALKLTKTPCQLHLRGHVAPAYRDFLKSNVPPHVQLFLHEVVPYHVLLSRIMEHDLGIAFEEDYPENKNLTISNKIFHYLQAGVAVLATETAGQKEIANRALKAVCTSTDNPNIMAAKIDGILADTSILEQMKNASWDAGGTTFAFENEEIKLLQFIKLME